MIFIGSDKLLLATPTLTLELLSVTSSGHDTPIKVLQTLDKENGGFEPEDCIHLMDVSRDGRFVAVAGHTAKIHVINVETLTIHSILPRYKSHPTALAFHPNSRLLVVAYADHKVTRPLCVEGVPFVDVSSCVMF